MTPTCANCAKPRDLHETAPEKCIYAGERCPGWETRLEDLTDDELLAMLIDLREKTGIPVERLGELLPWK